MAENQDQSTLKEALERGEFVLSEGAEAHQVADQGESSADQQFEEGTATARALAQSQKERDNAQEAMANVAQEKRKALSQETVGQVRTIQSGRQAEDIQKEEEQRKRVAEAKERLASYAPTRPDVGNHSVNTSSEPNQSIPVFSNQAQHLGLSEDLTKLDHKEEKAAKKLARQAARDKKKAEKLAAKAKSKEEQTVAKLEKRLESQVRLLETIQNANQKSQKAKNWGKGALIS